MKVIAKEAPRKGQRRPTGCAVLEGKEDTLPRMKGNQFGEGMVLNSGCSGLQDRMRSRRLAMVERRAFCGQGVEGSERMS